MVKCWLRVGWLVGWLVGWWLTCSWGVAQSFPTGSQTGGGARAQNPAPGIANARPLDSGQQQALANALKCLCEAAKGVDVAPPGSSPAQQDALKKCKKSMEQACADALGGGGPCECGSCCDTKFPRDFCAADIQNAEGGTPPDLVQGGVRLWTDDPGNKIYVQASSFEPGGAYVAPELKSKGIAPALLESLFALLAFHELHRCREVLSSAQPDWKWEGIVQDLELWEKDRCVIDELLKKIVSAAAPGTYENRQIDLIKESVKVKWVFAQREYYLKKSEFPDCRRPY